MTDRMGRHGRIGPLYLPVMSNVFIARQLLCDMSAVINLLALSVVAGPNQLDRSRQVKVAVRRERR